MSPYKLPTVKLWSDAMGLYFKTLRNRNLKEMDRVCSKLVTFGFSKQTH
jgi:hypothetical protein